MNKHRAKISLIGAVAVTLLLMCNCATFARPGGAVFLPGGTAAVAATRPPELRSLRPLFDLLWQATVRIESGGDLFSGVLISASGDILTVAH